MVVLPGVKIGKGSTVGAGSVVTKVRVLQDEVFCLSKKIQYKAVLFIPIIGLEIISHHQLSILSFVLSFFFLISNCLTVSCCQTSPGRTRILRRSRQSSQSPAPAQENRNDRTAWLSTEEDKGGNHS